METRRIDRQGYATFDVCFLNAEVLTWGVGVGVFMISIAYLLLRV